MDNKKYTRSPSPFGALSFTIPPISFRMRLIPRNLKWLWRRSSTGAYPVFPPPTPEELLAHPNVHREGVFQRVHRTPKGKPEDTPLFPLYRLYEHLTLACETKSNISGTRSGQLRPFLTPRTPPSLVTRSFLPSQRCWSSHSTSALSWVCHGKQTPSSRAKN